MKRSRKEVRELIRRTLGAAASRVVPLGAPARGPLDLLRLESQIQQLNASGASDFAKEQPSHRNRRPAIVLAVERIVDKLDDEVLQLALSRLRSLGYKVKDVEVGREGRLNVGMLTVEDPLEFLGPMPETQSLKSTQSFAEALRAALREDPDVILVGELRLADLPKTLNELQIPIQEIIVFRRTETRWLIGRPHTMMTFSAPREASYEGKAIDHLVGEIQAARRNRDKGVTDSVPDR